MNKDSYLYKAQVLKSTTDGDISVSEERQMTLVSQTHIKYTGLGSI